MIILEFILLGIGYFLLVLAIYTNLKKKQEKKIKDKKR